MYISSTVTAMETNFMQSNKLLKIQTGKPLIIVSVSSLYMRWIHLVFHTPMYIFLWILESNGRWIHLHVSYTNAHDRISTTFHRFWCLKAAEFTYTFHTPMYMNYIIFLSILESKGQFTIIWWDEATHERNTRPCKHHTMTRCNQLQLAWTKLRNNATYNIVNQP